MLANLIKAYAAASGISGAQLDSIIAAAADGLGFTLNFRPQICRVSQLQAQDGRQLVYAVSALGQYPQAELAAKAQEAAARINQLGLLCAQPLLTLMARDHLLSVILNSPPGCALHQQILPALTVQHGLLQLLLQRCLSSELSVNKTVCSRMNLVCCQAGRPRCWCGLIRI